MPLLLDQTLAEQLLQQVEAHLGIVEDRRVDALGVAPQRLLLVADRLRELGLGDRAAVELRDFGSAAAALEVVVDAEERERNHDQREDELRDPLVLVDEIEHPLRPIVWPCALRGACCRLRTAASVSRRPRGTGPSAARCEKGELAFALRNWRSGRDSNPRPPA